MNTHTLKFALTIIAGLVAAGVESLLQGQVRLETPHLAIAYQGRPESTFWRT